MWSKFGDKDNPEFNVAKRKYFDALAKKGYDAIVDEWDTRKDVFRSDAPLILLNTSSKSFGEMSIKELQARDILISQANSKDFKLKRNILNLMGTPHTNHFNESSKYLKRYAEKNARNTERIDTALRKSGMTELEALDKALKNKSGVLSDTGKYLLKNKNMSFDKAFKRATIKQNAKDKASGMAALTTLYGMYTVPYYAVSEAQKNASVRKYLKEHPNTKLTVKEIEKMYGYSSTSSANNNVKLIKQNSTVKP